MATIINSSKVALAMEIVKVRDTSSKLAIFRYLAAPVRSNRNLTWRRLCSKCARKLYKSKIQYDNISVDGIVDVRIQTPLVDGSGLGFCPARNFCIKKTIDQVVS